MPNLNFAGAFSFSIKEELLSAGYGAVVEIFVLRSVGVLYLNCQPVFIF